MIYWNGTSSDDLHLYVERYPDQLKPAKKISTVSVPARNGDLIFEEDAYENVIQPYEVYISAETTKLPAAAKAVASWLYAPKGYARLQDDYDTDTFRLAYYSGPTNIENVFNRFGRATLEFNCKPQRFLISGETPITMSTEGNVVNPTVFEAKPLIKVYGEGNGEITINGKTISFEIPSEDTHVEIDSDLQDVFEVNAQNEIIDNLNSTASGAFPTIAGGTNAVTWSGDITNIAIVPRWWTL